MKTTKITPRNPQTNMKTGKITRETHRNRKNYIRKNMKTRKYPQKPAKTGEIMKETQKIIPETCKKLPRYRKIYARNNTTTRKIRKKPTKLPPEPAKTRKTCDNRKNYRKKQYENMKNYARNKRKQGKFTPETRKRGKLHKKQEKFHGRLRVGKRGLKLVGNVPPKAKKNTQKR